MLEQPESPCWWVVPHSEKQKRKGGGKKEKKRAVTIRTKKKNEDWSKKITLHMWGGVAEGSRLILREILN